MIVFFIAACGWLLGFCTGKKSAALGVPLIVDDDLYTITKNGKP